VGEVVIARGCQRFGDDHVAPGGGEHARQLLAWIGPFEKREFLIGTVQLNTSMVAKRYHIIST
jgi:hypothetical protein